MILPDFRFWLIFLGILSALTMAYSLAVITLPSIRELILVRRFRFGTPAGVSALIKKTQVIFTTYVCTYFLKVFFFFRFHGYSTMLNNIIVSKAGKASDNYFVIILAITICLK